MNLSKWRIEDAKDREIISHKIFDEPPDFVFAMYTKPEYVDKWWGPTGFTTKTVSMDFRTGGSWSYQMIAPDGTIYDNLINYLQIKENKEIIYTNKSPTDDDYEFLTIINFNSHELGTELVVHMIFRNLEDYIVSVEEFGAIEGLRQTLSRLEAFVKDQTA